MSLKVDLKSIVDRLEELKKNKSVKPYEKQQTSLQRELLRFLASLPIPKSLSSASSADILKFLVWKDKSGRTKVHRTSFPELGKPNPLTCDCPSRLSAGTVESLVGKLRSIFIDAGLGGEWDDRLGIGNPVSHPSVKDYFRFRRVLSREVLFFPQSSGILFNHTFGKTLRGDSVNTFAV